MSRPETSRAPEQHLQAAAALGERAGDERGPLPLVRREGTPRRRPRATRMGPSASWTRRSSSTGRGSSRTCVPSRPIKARIWIAQGKLSEAADWARDRGVSVTDDASYLSEFDHLTLVRLMLAQHRANRTTAAHSPRPPACWTGCLTPPRRLDGPEVSSRSACCRPSSTTRRDIGRRPWSPWPGIGAGARTGGLRPALPGRGRPHAEPAARRPRTAASRATIARRLLSLAAAPARLDSRHRASAWRRRRPSR